MCENFGIQIPGFRKGNTPKNMKALIIGNMLNPKNLKKLKINAIISNSNEYKIEEILNSKAPEVLKELCTTYYPPSKVLEILLINEYVSDANDLFYDLKETYDEEKLDQLESKLKNKFASKEVPSDTNTSSLSKEKSSSKVNKKLQEKIKSLESELKKTQTDYKTLRDSNNQKINDKSLQIQTLTTEKGLLKKENRSLKEEAEIKTNEWINHEKALIKQIKKLETENKELKEIEQKQNDTNSDNWQLETKANVTVIGKPNNSVLKQSSINFTTINKNDALNRDFGEQDEKIGRAHV